MPGTPWKTVADLDPSHEYVVMATRFTVTSRVHLPKIVSTTRQFWNGIEAVPGLVGFSLRADPLYGSLATLTAWHDRDLLMAFVRAEPHISVVSGTRKWLRQSAFASWTLTAAKLPPNWDEAERQLRRDFETSRDFDTNG